MKWLIIFTFLLGGCAKPQMVIAPEWMQPGYRVSEYEQGREYERGYKDGYRDARGIDAGVR